MKPHHIKLKWLFRSHEGVYRIARIIWQRGKVGNGKGFSAKLSFAFCRKLLLFCRDGRDGWFVILAGVRLHYLRAYGGIFS